MERQYKNICEEYGDKAKVFTKMSGDLSDRIGAPDLLVMFTDTLSHKVVKCASCSLKGTDTCIKYCKKSSASALRSLLDEHYGGPRKG